MPSSGLWEQAQPGWRSAADMQRVEAWRAEMNVRREGVGSPEPPRWTDTGLKTCATGGTEPGQMRVDPSCISRAEQDWQDARSECPAMGVGSPERRGGHRLKNLCYERRTSHRLKTCATGKLCCGERWRRIRPHSVDSASSRSSFTARRAGSQAARAVTARAASRLAMTTPGRMCMASGWPSNG